MQSAPEVQPAMAPAPAGQAEPPKPEQPEPDKSAEPKTDRKTLIRTIAIFLLIFAAAMFLGLFIGNRKKANNQTPTAAASNTTAVKVTTPKAQGVVLDPNKNYGNKYASGILPVGDGKYVTTAAKQGNIYACGSYAQSLKSGQGGVQTRGPWFTNNNASYDLNKKVHVQGSVVWKPSFTDTISGATRTITTNDLPSHVTGVFPISAKDPAYSYDKNPNSIKAQSLTYALNNSPTYGAAQCMGGEAGVMITGVALFNGFDAGGRDAGAWEVQDDCSGHPQVEGEYHYHTLSSCIKDVSVHTVIGFALDGFPITGPQVGTNNVLTTSDLDECHGLTGSVIVQGKSVTVYHYVMTQDFPYSVSCFRSTAIQPPGMQVSSPAQHP